MKRKHKEALKEIVAGTVAGAVLGWMFVYAMEVDAAGADTKLPKEYQIYCEEIGEDYGICPETLMAQIEQESDGNPDAVGKYGEIGLMQIYPKWHMVRAEELGVYNLFDPKGNILVAADYLAELIAEYGDIAYVLDIYNGNSDAEYNYENGIMSEYATKVLERSAELERIQGKW